MSRCIAAVRLTGSVFPPSCQAVWTPNASARCANFWAGVIPPIFDTRQRMKSISRSEISGSHSWTFVNSSPMPCGVAHC